MSPYTSWSQVARRIRVPLGFVFAALYLWLARPVWYSVLVGAAVAVGGLGLRAAASGHVEKNAKLTTTGPYAYTRNPLYLGSVIIALGFAVAARSVWIVILLSVIFVIIYVPVIRAEERFLRSTFPEYDAYAKLVPRFGIRWGRSRSTGGQFSARLYLRHREYNAAIGTTLMVAALVLKLYWQCR